MYCQPLAILTVPLPRARWKWKGGIDAALGPGPLYYCAVDPASLAVRLRATRVAVAAWRGKQPAVVVVLVVLNEAAAICPRTRFPALCLAKVLPRPKLHAPELLHLPLSLEAVRWRKGNG